ncbi:MAG TPA: C1 family peptidase [Tenuifilaceae bacterium]|nr:C1 family peptidase [Tenuifilaceae bacterium]HPQ35412.1 C1 family peptidase [Tenuifilaceae bacterium]
MKKNKLVKLSFFALILGITITTSCKKDETVIVINDNLGTRFDWRDSSIVTPAKNQGNYGSCGVFAAMGALESAIAKKTEMFVDLSEQHYINASTTWDATTGVSPMTVYDFIIENGIVIESRLPYQATITNEIPQEPMDFFLSSYETVSLENFSASESVKKVKENILAHGPVAAAMDIMSDLKYYSGGIYTPGSNSVNCGGHWVVIVGWENDASLTQGGYWIVKNSSGTSWGENGFFKIPYTVCNLDRYVIVYPVF